MNKYARFLIVFIIAVAMFALTWRKDSAGALVGDSLSAFGSATPTLPAVVENTASPENTVSMHNLILVEFFAGY